MTPAALRAWRKSFPPTGLAQWRAAMMLAVKVGTYRNWEAGRRKIPPTVVRIIELLDKTQEEK